MEKKREMNDRAVRLSCTREKIESTKKKILETVESLLEMSVSDDHLISACKTLSQADYLDVIEERNILNLCGYPLCRKTVKVPPQKYQIHYNAKKVYDITARKCFCSNLCYKASNFVKSQLLEIPVWYQEEPAKVALLKDLHNSGSAGEEIVMHDKITLKDVNAKNANHLATDCKKLLLDEITQCAAAFKDKLVIKEKETVFPEETSASISDGVNESSCLNSVSSNERKLNSVKQRGSSCHSSDEDESETQSDSSFSDDDNKYFLKSKEELYPSHKLMPSVPAKPVRSPVLITPLPIGTKSNNTIQISSSFLDQLWNIFTEWITLATYEFLLSDEGLSASDIRELFNTRVPLYEEPTKDTDMRESYLKLCMKLDKMEEQEKEFEEKVIREADSESASVDEGIAFKELTPEEKVAIYFKPETEAPEPSKKKSSAKGRSKKKRTTAKSRGNPKAVPSQSCLPPHAKESKIKSEEEPNNLSDPVLPVVDSVSQVVLRKQVVISKLRISYLDLLPLIGLHYKNISDDVRLLVMTFRFSPTNILFRAAEWKAIALVLFRMLKRKISDDFCSDSMFESLLEKASLCPTFTLEFIDSLVVTVINTKKDL